MRQLEGGKKKHCGDLPCGAIDNNLFHKLFSVQQMTLDSLERSSYKWLHTLLYLKIR